MFHVEVKEFPNSARRFNLTREQLDEKFLAPLRKGQSIEFEEQNYSPEKVKLRILEGPQLRIDQIGLGRGWQTAERDGEDVTRRIMDENRRGAGLQNDAIGEFKAAVQGACAFEPRPLGDVVKLASARYPGARASERMALAERAVWELLHQRLLTLLAGEGSEPVSADGWEPVLLAWESWTAPRAGQPRLSAAPQPPATAAGEELTRE